jgi:hypothetical protein
MNKVAKALMAPHHCAVNPHLGSEPRGGLWDTGHDLQGPGSHLHRVYVASSTVEDLARRDGWISKDEAQHLRQHIASLVRELGDAKAKLEGAQAKLDAIDVIESEGFTARKKAGRPKTKVAG